MKREMFLVIKLHDLQITYESVTSNPNVIRQNQDAKNQEKTHSRLYFQFI